MRLLIKKSAGKFFEYVSFIEKGVEIGKIDLDHRQDEVKLWSFYILEAYRNKGFGFKALQKLIKKLKGKNLWLHVYKDNKIAIKLYKKIGFKVINDNPVRLSYEMVYKHLDNPEG